MHCRLQINSYDIYDSQKQPEAPIEAQPLISAPATVTDAVEALPAEVVPAAASDAVSRGGKRAGKGVRRTDSRTQSISSFARSSECAAYPFHRLSHCRAVPLSLKHM